MRPRERTATDDLFEMANLFPQTTGLPVTVWVSPRGHARHAARIKVSSVPGPRMVIDDAATVAILPQPALIDGTLAPDVMRHVADWIALNNEALIAFWNGEIDTIELGARLRRV